MSARIPVELADLRLRGEAEGGRVGDPGQLALAVAVELLLDLALPAQGLQDADGPLRVQHPLREPREDLLVRSPRARLGRGGDVGDRLVAQGEAVERGVREGAGVLHRDGVVRRAPAPIAAYGCLGGLGGALWPPPSGDVGPRAGGDASTF